MNLVCEWKGIAGHIEKTYGISVPIRTLQKWHKKFFPIPFVKTVQSKTGRVIIPMEALDCWVEAFRRLFPGLYKVRRIAVTKRAH